MVGGCRRTVVPPAPIPEALEERRGVAGEEVQVGAEGLLDQAKMAAGSVVEGHGLDGPREVHRQVEDIPRLGLGLQKRQATQ